MYEWINECALSYKGATQDYKAEWAEERFMVDGKMFAMKGGDKQNKPILTLKCDPEQAPIIRQRYEDIIPGYYMNKAHWNSIYLEGSVPRETIEAMIAEAYTLLLASFSKKKRLEILENSNIEMEANR